MSLLAKTDIPTGISDFANSDTNRYQYAYNIATAVRITSDRLLMNITNKSGPSTLPCIIPLGTLTIFDLADPIFTNCCLSRKKSDIQCKTNLLNP